MVNLLRDGEGEYVIKTSQSQKFTINGITNAYPVYRVRLDKLFYNDQNDRIATWLSQYRSEHGADVFSTLEREEYNEIIESFKNYAYLTKDCGSVVASGEDKNVKKALYLCFF